MTTAIKERPILFSAEMVRALLSGAKTQTRLPVTRQNSTVLGYTQKCFWDQLNWQFAWKDAGPDPFGGSGYEYLHVAAWNSEDGPMPKVDSLDDWSDSGGVVYRVRPRWEPGDLLWVREAWGAGWKNGVGGYSALKPTGEQYERPDKIFYRADGWDESKGRYPWRHPLHMPRWASRITLEITGVRAEQVQEISEEDAIAEGVERCNNIIGDPSVFIRESIHIDRFARLWDSLYARKGFGWKENSWVWVPEFKVVRPTTNQSETGDE